MGWVPVNRYPTAIDAAQQCIFYRIRTVSDRDREPKDERHRRSSPTPAS